MKSWLTSPISRPSTWLIPLTISLTVGCGSEESEPDTSSNALSDAPFERFAPAGKGDFSDPIHHYEFEPVSEGKSRVWVQTIQANEAGDFATETEAAYQLFEHLEALYNAGTSPELAIQREEHLDTIYLQSGPLLCARRTNPYANDPQRNWVKNETLCGWDMHDADGFPKEYEVHHSLADRENPYFEFVDSLNGSSAAEHIIDVMANVPEPSTAHGLRDHTARLDSDGDGRLDTFWLGAFQCSMNWADQGVPGCRVFYKGTYLVHPTPDIYVAPTAEAYHLYFAGERAQLVVELLNVNNDIPEQPDWRETLGISRSECPDEAGLDIEEGRKSCHIQIPKAGASEDVDINEFDDDPLILLAAHPYDIANDELVVRPDTHFAGFLFSGLEHSTGNSRSERTMQKALAFELNHTQELADNPQARISCVVDYVGEGLGDDTEFAYRCHFPHLGME